MVKIEKKVNKSAEIRLMRYNFPTMGPSKMSEMLAARGIKVAPATISTVLSTTKKRGGNIGKPGRPAGTKSKVRELPLPAGTYDPEAVEVMVDNLVAVRTVVKQVGGVDTLISLAKSLKKLESV